MEKELQQCSSFSIVLIKFEGYSKYLNNLRNLILKISLQNLTRMFQQN